jgi:hypothetical protein
LGGDCQVFVSQDNVLVAWRHPLAPFLARPVLRGVETKWRF